MNKNLKQKGRTKEVTATQGQKTKVNVFENPKNHDMPVLANLFGTPKRVALGMGQDSVEALREVGKLLAFLKEPEPPKGIKDLISKVPIFKQVLNMPAKQIKKAPCQEIVLEGDDVDLDQLPIQRCWPGDTRDG